MRRFPLVLTSLLVLAAIVPLSEAAESRDACDGAALSAQSRRRLSAEERTFVDNYRESRTAPFRVAAAELLAEGVARDTTASACLRAAAEGQLIDAELEVGLSAAALHRYEQLPEALRWRVVRGPIVETERAPGTSSPYRLQVDPAMTAAALAVAYAERGRPERADALLLMVDQAPALPDDGKTYRRRRKPQLARCLATLLHPAEPIDGFGWLYGDARAKPAVASCNFVLASRDFQRRADTLLQQSSLPASWQPGIRALELAGEHDYWSHPEDAITALNRLPTWRDRAEALRTQLADIDRRDAAGIAKSAASRGPRELPADGAPAPTPGATDRALAATLTTRLAAPLIDPYRISPVARGLASKGPNTPSACAPGELRCIDLAGLHWALAVSQDLDPSGEVPAAGFWLRRQDRASGRTDAFYLGLKEHQPFELVDGDLPLITEGTLQLRVRHAAIRNRTIMFPPVGLQFETDGAEAILSASLDDLTRDSDGDGLTDLAEQQLLLDPQRGDSDGDGIPDGTDSVPDVASGPITGVRQRAFNAALAELTGESDAAISVGVPGSESFVQRQSGDERTLFVVTDPDNLASVRTSRRIVVLPESLDLALLRKHPSFAVFYPMHLSLRVLPDGHHAELVYDAGWRGGTLVMELSGDRWRIATSTQWIT
jgi:hypothetical protein